MVTPYLTARMFNSGNNGNFSIKFDSERSFTQAFTGLIKLWLTSVQYYGDFHMLLE
jgi:hypothetical protein